MPHKQTIRRPDKPRYMDRILRESTPLDRTRKMLERKHYKFEDEEKGNVIPREGVGNLVRKKIRKKPNAIAAGIRA